MAHQLDLCLRIRIDYLDEDLLETVLNYGGSGGVERTKEVLRAVADNLDDLTKTDNGDIWESYEARV